MSSNSPRIHSFVNSYKESVAVENAAARIAGLQFVSVPICQH